MKTSSSGNPNLVPQITDVDIRLLRVFRAVVKCRGFSNAETDLNISRSTISLHMSDLERRLGIRLCERGPAGFTLTERGREAYDATSRLFSELENFRSEIGKIRGLITGQLNIGIIDNTITDPASPMKKALKVFQTIAEQVNIHIQVLSPLNILQQVMDGRLHMGIVPRHADHPELQYVSLYSETNALCCARSHPLFDRAPNQVKLEELRNLPYISFHYIPPSKTKGPSQLAEQYGLKPAAMADSMEGATMLMLTGKYAGFLPLHYMNQWEHRDEVRAIRMKELSYDVEMAVVHRKSKRHPLALEKFLEELMIAKEEGKKQIR